MTEAVDKSRSHDDEDTAQSLSAMAARRLAARTQWQRALARAKDRFAPANLRDEAVGHTAEKIGGAVDRGGAFAWAHRGKIAVAGLLGGLFLARKPIAKTAGPLAAHARRHISKAADDLTKARKR